MGSFQVDKCEFVESDESLEQKGERMGLEDLRKTWKERQRSKLIKSRKQGTDAKYGEQRGV